MNPHRLARWVRLGGLGAFLLLALLFLSRYRTWTLDEANGSMSPSHPPGSRVLVDWHPRPPVRGDVVIYELAGKGRTARVAALGGDRLEVRSGILFVNGAAAPHAVRRPSLLPGQVPAGEVLLLNDNPDSPLPDGLVHGPLPAGAIRGRILMGLDFF